MFSNPILGREEEGFSPTSSESALPDSVMAHYLYEEYHFLPSNKISQKDGTKTHL
jgi:hypothetical protein